MRSRAIIKGVICVLLTAAFLALAAVPAVKLAGPGYIEKVVPSSDASVSDVFFSYPPAVSFRDLSIERSGLLRFRAGAVKLSLASAVPWRPKFNLRVDDASVDILSFKGLFSELKTGIKARSAAAGSGMINVVELSGVRVRSLDPEVKGEGEISLSFDVLSGTVTSGRLRIGRVSKGSFKAEGISLDVTSPGTADLRVDSAVSGKLRIDDLSGSVRQKAGGLEVVSFSGKMFGGSLKGYGSAGRMLMGYSMDIVADGIDMARATAELGLGDKVDLTGILDGDISLEGKLSGPELLEGSLSLVSRAGTLLVKDKRFLETVAERTRQPLEIVKSSFEDYEFTTGAVNLELDGSDLVMTIYLDGDKGKRDIKVVLHEATGKEGGTL